MKVLMSSIFSLFKNSCTEVHTLIFVDHIVAWFEEKSRLEELKKDVNNLAVSVREKIEKGNYKIINCLFNKELGKIVGWEKEGGVAHIIAKELDAQTIEAFKDKDMIVLE